MTERGELPSVEASVEGRGRVEGVCGLRVAARAAPVLFPSWDGRCEEQEWRIQWNNAEN